MYKVVSAFYDMQNDDHVYEIGDTYPVAGYKPTKARIDELAKGTNRLGKVLIEKVGGETPPTDDGKPKK